MKKIISLYNKYILYEIVTLTCLFANIIYTHQIIMDMGRWYFIIYPTSHLFFFLLEGFSIYFISFLYPTKRHLILLSLYFISSIILWINVGYSRYFNTYMPLTLYNEFNNLNGLLPNIQDAIEIPDIFFIISSIIVLTTYFRLGREEKPKYGYILPCIFIFLLLLAFSIHYSSVKKDNTHLVNHFKDINDNRNVWNTMYDRWQMMDHTMPKTGFYYYGIGPSLFFKILNKTFRNDSFHFTNKEKGIINKYTNTSKYPFPEEYMQNLIFILIESLSSYPINKSYNGIELTPNINKLIKKAYYNSNMESQALLGESSDGQFIYLTGLLPLRNGVTINEISANHIKTFISLAKKQYPNIYSQMIIPTNKDSWSQESMCKKYSIDSLFSKENFPINIKEEWLNDKELFHFAQMKDQNLTPPFFNFILTSSMHSPYIKSFEKYSFNYPKGFSSELKHYLDNVHYMDKYLGEYIESLKKYPWFNNCTIIITADHKPNGPKLNTETYNLFAKLPLIIFCPSSIQQKDSVLNIAQTSIFPTILDLLHIKHEWRGVGKSIFMPYNIRMSSYEQEREKHQNMISDYIIDRDYIN